VPRGAGAEAGGEAEAEAEQAVLVAGVEAVLVVVRVPPMARHRLAGGRLVAGDPQEALGMGRALLVALVVALVVGLLPDPRPVVEARVRQAHRPALRGHRLLRPVQRPVPQMLLGVQPSQHPQPSRYLRHPRPPLPH